MKQHEDRQYQVQAYRVLLRCLCSILLFLGEVIHSILYQQVIPLKEFLDVGDMHPFTVIIVEHISHIVTQFGTLGLAEAMRPETAKHNIYETVKRLLLNE